MDFFFFVFLGASALAGHPSPRDDVAAAPAPAMPHTLCRRRSASASACSRRAALSWDARDSASAQLSVGRHSTNSYRSPRREGRFLPADPVCRASTAATGRRAREVGVAARPARRVHLRSSAAGLRKAPPRRASRQTRCESCACRGLGKKINKIKKGESELSSPWRPGRRGLTGTRRRSRIKR